MPGAALMHRPIGEATEIRIDGRPHREVIVRCSCNGPTLPTALPPIPAGENVTITYAHGHNCRAVYEPIPGNRHERRAQDAQRRTQRQRRA